ETGTGKELIARALHRHSLRREDLFVPVNCAAIAETLLESELFGHEKGAFTGAHQRHAGVFERANGGTLFMDEIAEMSLATQAKLLRALQESVIVPVGAEQALPIDVRIISATNKPLEHLMDPDHFRPDLFYRLNGYSIQVPPL